jgi:hypothetical protein
MHGGIFEISCIVGMKIECLITLHPNQFILEKHYIYLKLSTSFLTDKIKQRQINKIYYFQIMILNSLLMQLLFMYSLGSIRLVCVLDGA